MPLSLPNGSPTQQREREIRAARAEAQRLISRFNHEAMKDLVRRAFQDLDDAAIWLHTDYADVRPPILEIVDFHIRLGRNRLEQLDTWLRRYGPGADVLGLS